MANIALLLVCLVGGVVLRRLGALPDEASRALNRFIIYLSLPALVLQKVTPLFGGGGVTPSLFMPVAAAWVLFGLAFGVGKLAGRAAGWSPATTGTIILAMGLGNTLFVGYPLIEWRLGAGALPLAVLIDQLGSFLVLSSVAVVVAAAQGGRAVGASALVRRLIGFPPLHALLVAIVWGLSRTYHSVPIAFQIFEKLSVTLVPLALFSVGAALRLDRTLLARRWRQVGFGLGCKLVVLPALIWIVYRFGLRLTGQDLQVTVLQTAMAPMATSAVLVSEFGLDEELAALLLGLGIPLSIATVWGWSVLLRLG